MSKLVTRRVKRGKHVKRVKRGKRSRCGGKHSKRKGYNKKHYTRKYGRRNRSRSKRGGMFWENNDSSQFKFNFTTNGPILDGEPLDNRVLEAVGFAYVTKINEILETAFGATTDRVEQLRVYSIPIIGVDPKRRLYLIARCPSIDDCEKGNNMNKRLLQTTAFYNYGGVDSYLFTDSTTNNKYRIKPIDVNDRQYTEAGMVKGVMVRQLRVFLEERKESGPLAI